MKQKQLPNFSDALSEHSPEGIAILTSEPSRLMYATLWLMISLLVVGLVWSFIGRADVIVSTPGILVPESEVRRVFTPIDGELVEIYATEGFPVTKGDIIARINARDAIKVTMESLDAQVRLESAKRDYKNFPERKKVLQGKAEALNVKIKADERHYKKRLEEGMRKLAEKQKAKLAVARAQIDKARHLRDASRLEASKYKRLFNMAGGGGISKQQVEEKIRAAISAETDYQMAEAQLNELSIQLIQGSVQERKELEEMGQKLREMRLEYHTLRQNIKTEEDKIKSDLRRAHLAAEAAKRINFRNIDEDGFLKIIAPASGVITEISASQAGDKVQALTPLVSIAPEGAQAVLELKIEEKDRGFLREGQAVKMKFNAFPYARYGVIKGTLEYVSPAAQTATTETPKKLIYKGRVSLKRDYFTVEKQRVPLRYGMKATAEIVVRERRLIDMALDPFRAVIQ